MPPDVVRVLDEFDVFAVAVDFVGPMDALEEVMGNGSAISTLAEGPGGPCDGSGIKAEGDFEFVVDSPLFAVA